MTLHRPLLRLAQIPRVILIVMVPTNLKVLTNLKVPTKVVMTKIHPNTSTIITNRIIMDSSLNLKSLLMKLSKKVALNTKVSSRNLKMLPKKKWQKKRKNLRKK